MTFCNNPLFPTLFIKNKSKPLNDKTNIISKLRKIQLLFLIFLIIPDIYIFKIKKE